MRAARVVETGTGRKPLAHRAVDLVGTPEGDTLQWLYTALLVKQDGELAGAAAVFEEAT